MAYEINFCETKEQLKHLGEVVTGKTDGSPTGADIDTSTLEYTGQVRRTLPDLEAQYVESIQAAGGVSLGAWQSGVTEFTKYNEYAVYNNIAYKPKKNTPLPYTAQGSDPTSPPDSDFVQPYQLNDYGNLPDGVQVQYRRGTNAEVMAGTPAIGELWFNTTDNSIHMGDGATPGGAKHVNLSNLPGYTTLMAMNVSMMIGGFTLNGQSIAHEVGQRWSSGLGVWEVTSVPVTSISNFKPMSDVWVDDFGADRFGVIDSLSAINSALAVKGVVRLSVGTYMTSEEILIDSDTIFKGAGKFASAIRPNQDFRDLAFNNGGRNILKNKDAADNGAALYNANRDIVIEDMRFLYRDDDPAVDDKINCIGFNNAKRLTVRNCYFANLSQHSVDISGCDDVLVEGNVCVNGYWSQIQVDNGGGLYNIPGFAGTTKSTNIKILNNWCTGSKTAVGAIQIHKKGGDNVIIEGNTIIGGVSGIVADDYFANSYTIEASYAIRVLNNYVSVSNDALNLGKTIFNLQVRGNTLYSTSAFSLRIQAGDGTSQYCDNATIADNKCFGNIYIVGLRKSSIYGNNFEDQTTEAVISSKETMMSCNNLELKGVVHKDVSLTDPRDSTVYNYALSNNKVNNNICNNGSGVGFSVESTAFNIIEYADNTPFLTSNGYDFSLATVTSGFLINDYFRKSLRPSDPSALPEPLEGQQAYYAAAKKPVWYNGTNWIYADGTVAI